MGIRDLVRLMSYGGHISDRALWDASWYSGLFVYPNGTQYTFTFYDAEDRQGRPYGILFAPKFDPNAKGWCTGDSRQRNFFTKAERYLFYKKMSEFLESIGRESTVQYMYRRFMSRHLTDDDRFDHNYYLKTIAP